MHNELRLELECHDMEYLRSQNKINLTFYMCMDIYNYNMGFKSSATLK